MSNKEVQGRSTEYKGGDTIYILRDYNVIEATIVKVNKASLKCSYTEAWCRPETRSIPWEKVLGLPHELCCVVWETWRGKNGRGAYRIDRSQAYHEYLVPAYKVEHQPTNENVVGSGRLKEVCDVWGSPNFDYSLPVKEHVKKALGL